MKIHIDRTCGFRYLHPTDARKPVETIVTTKKVSRSERGICEKVNDKHSCVIKVTKNQNTATKEAQGKYIVLKSLAMTVSIINNNMKFQKD